MAEATSAKSGGVGIRAAASDSRLALECTKVLGLSTNNLQFIVRMRSIGLEDTPEEFVLVSHELSAFLERAC